MKVSVVFPYCLPSQAPPCPPVFPGPLPLSGDFEAQVVAWGVCMKGAEDM